MPSFSLRALKRVLLAGALAAPGLALAQDAPPSVDELIVTGARLDSDPPVVADARKRLSETPGAVSVVASETYETRQALSLVDTLRDVPGVMAQKKWGEDIRLSIRGSGIGNNNHNRGVLLAQDGVPFNEADGAGDFQMIDPLIARYTEVYKGGNALRFGGALLGGAINQITPTGRTADPGLLLRAEAGSFGLARLHAEFAQAGGANDAFAAITLLDAEGPRVQSAQSAARVSLNLGHAYGEDREVRLILSGADVVQEIPGALNLTQALNTPKMATPANLPGGLNSHRNIETVRGALQSRWRVSDALVFEGGAYATWKDLDHPIFQVLAHESVNLGAFGRLDWTGQAAGRPADAFAGIWLRSGRLEDDRFVNLQGSQGARTLDATQRSDAADLFAEGRLFVTEQIALTVGGTAGWARRDFENHTNPALDAETTYGWFAPRVGVLWQGPSGAQAFVNLTRSIEPPNMTALAQNSGAFASLDPQVAWTAEAGVRGRTEHLVWDVSVYRAELKDELLTFVPNPGAGIPAASFNAGPTVHQGLDAGLDWRITRHVRLRQTYSWSDFEFDGDAVYGDNRLPIAPEHAYRAELRYEHPAGWFLAPSLEWVPQGAFIDYRNTVRSPGYSVWALNGGWTNDAGLNVFFEARNLFDEAYVSNVNAIVDAGVLGPAQPVFWPGDPRSIFVGLTKAF